jgi:hypothetical protein
MATDILLRVAVQPDNVLRQDEKVLAARVVVWKHWAIGEGKEAHQFAYAPRREA